MGPQNLKKKEIDFMDYPKFKFNYTKQELKIFFTLTPEELRIINKIRMKKNKLGYAILLKSYQFLCYPNILKSQIPFPVKEWIADQLLLSPTLFREYKWKSKTFKRHLSEIRNYVKYNEYDNLVAHHKIFKWPESDLLNFPIDRSEFTQNILLKFKKLKMELPSGIRFYRYVNSLYQKLFSNVYQYIYQRINKDVKKRFCCKKLKFKN